QLNFLFGAPGNNDMVLGIGGTATTTMLLQPGIDILNVNDLPSFATGTYTLLQATGGTIFTDNTNTTSFAINGNTAFNYSLSVTNGVNGGMALIVTPGNPTLGWTGSIDGNWD